MLYDVKIVIGAEMGITTTKINNFNLLINKFYYLLIKLSNYSIQINLHIQRGNNERQKGGESKGQMKALGMINTMPRGKKYRKYVK